MRAAFYWGGFLTAGVPIAAKTIKRCSFNLYSRSSFLSFATKLRCNRTENLRM